ncbi:MAG: hypothetical protein AB7G75_32275 [Candidatus Binatia bacterium]
MGQCEQEQRTFRLRTTFDALSNCLSRAGCQRCEILEICLKRLQEDVLDSKGVYPKSLLQTLRQAVPFVTTHRRENCRRCLPAEILMTYLTPQ